jgi:hypothetical protein
LVKPAGIIGYYFHKFEKDRSVWHNIETNDKKEKKIVQTLKLTKEEYKNRRSQEKE